MKCLQLPVLSTAVIWRTNHNSEQLRILPVSVQLKYNSSNCSVNILQSESLLPLADDGGVLSISSSSGSCRKCISRHLSQPRSKQ